MPNNVQPLAEKAPAIATKSRKWSFIVSVLLILGMVAVVLVIGQLDTVQYSKKIAGAQVCYESARVVEVLDQSLRESTLSDSIQVGEQSLRIEMLTGTHRGEKVSASNYLSTYNSVVAENGQKLTVIVDELDSGQFEVRVFNHSRSNFTYGFVLLFFLTMIVVSGKKGLMSCLSLIYTFVSIFFIFLPLIMRGYPPAWVAIGLVVLVTTANMIFLNGISRKTLCAILGTASGVILSGIILLIFSSLVNVSGLYLEDVEKLLFIRQETGLGVENILFAGVLIASMGAVMDTSLSIVSAIHELHVHAPDLSGIKLFKAGMNVGKDMIGTMSNTLILAFVGAGLSTIIILNYYSIQYIRLINSNYVAVEIAQAMSGSMGVILTIPLTAAITAKLLKK